MLISHKKGFIYFKTKKTAGTTVEIFFEKECVSPEMYIASHQTEQKITDYGIIGLRGELKRYKRILPFLQKKIFNREICNQYFKHTWYNHMPASDIKFYIGDEKFNKYFKFCVIRNPFDKIVSWWWWHMFKNRDNINYYNRIYHSDFKDIRNSFLEWVKNTDKLLIDRDVYCINGNSVMDYHIRYENLENDIKQVCKTLEIEFDAKCIKQYKSGIRLPQYTYQEYYDQVAITKIQKMYQWELETFNYNY